MRQNPSHSACQQQNEVVEESLEEILLGDAFYTIAAAVYYRAVSESDDKS